MKVISNGAASVSERGAWRDFRRSAPGIGDWLSRVRSSQFEAGSWDSLHVLKRRSQKTRLTAERVTRLRNRWLSRPRLVHPYPEVRFDATYPR
jgi:hypothetical protein